MRQSSIGSGTSYIIETIEKIIGKFTFYFWGIIGVICLIGYPPAGIMCFIFALIGKAMINASNKRRQLREDSKLYIMYLSNDPERKISKLAMSMGLNKLQVYKRLDKMIQRRLIKNIYVDKAHDRVLIVRPDGTFIYPQGSNVNNSNNSANNTRNANNNSAPRYVLYTCPHCGATNQVLTGTVSICEYCDSKISV